MISHRTLVAGGLSMHVAEAGPADGPLVVLLHGFPEGWATWRHQLPALADAGVHVVAPDQRGFGGSDAPPEAAEYTMLHLVGDVVGLLDALEAPTAVVVGHDWGAPVAWNTALLRPDRVRGVVGMSVPYSPPSDLDILTALDMTLGPHHYQRWFQTDEAAAEADADVRRWLITFYDALGGHHGRPHDLVLGQGRSLLDALRDHGEQPPWLTDADVDHLVEQFTRTGLTPGLCWYRNAARNAQLLRPWSGQPVTAPAGYLTGDLDVVYRWPFAPLLIDAFPQTLPNLVESLVLPGVGHWTSEEAPEETSAFLLRFLAALDA